MRAKDNVNIIYLVESPKNYFSCRRFSYILLLPMMAEDNIELPQDVSPLIHLMLYVFRAEDLKRHISCS